MPFAVAAPAAVIGVIGVLMVLSDAEASYLSGIFFGLGAAVLLLSTGKQPVKRVSPPSWLRTILIGLYCGASLYLIGWVSVGVDGFAAALVGGAACAVADRRTLLSHTPRNVYRVMLVLFVLAAAEALMTQPIVGLAALTGAGAGLLFPIDLLRRPKIRPHSAHSSPDSGGYHNEVLALAAFLDPTDIPKSMVLEAAREVGVGRASSLRTLAAGALLEVGPDSLQARPMALEFARQRMLREERKTWASRAVQLMARRFPSDPKAGDQLAERLMPHALAVAGHAEKLGVEPAATAAILNRVAAFLVASGRHEDARAARERALAHASASPAETEAELAALQQAEEAKRAAEEEQTYSGRSALAFGLAQTGDIRRDAGDDAGARRDYRAALSQARFSLPRSHPLIADVRARLAALPAPTRDQANEKRLVLGCFGLVVAIVLICAGFTVVRDLTEGRSQASDKELTSADQLIEVCHSSQKYFRDAAAFAGPEPHPAQIFLRTNNDAGFKRELFGGDANPRRTQLVACVVQIRTGPPVAKCTFPTQPEIPLHEAAYDVTVYETWTGRRLGTQPVTATKGQCPPVYVAPPEGKPWMLYAAPSDEQYRQVLQPIFDQLPPPPGASGSADANPN